MTNWENIKHDVQDINFLTLQRVPQSVNIYRPIKKSGKIQIGN